MKKITELTGRAGMRLRDRMRSIGRRVMEIARISRSKGPQVQKKMKQGYRNLLTPTRKVANGVKRAANCNQKAVLQALREDLETMLPRVQQVLRQAKARVLGGDIHAPEKPVSVFEPSRGGDP